MMFLADQVPNGKMRSPKESAPQKPTSNKLAISMIRIALDLPTWGPPSTS